MGRRAAWAEVWSKRGSLERLAWQKQSALTLHSQPKGLTEAVAGKGEWKGLEDQEGEEGILRPCLKDAFCTPETWRFGAAPFCGFLLKFSK